MKRVEETLSSLIPALEAHEIGRWSVNQVELLCAMLREYGLQARASAATGSTHSASSSNSEEDEGRDEEALFAEAVRAVDRGLSRTREYLKGRLPYGARPEPTQIPGSQAALAAAAPARKRARSPETSNNCAIPINGDAALTSLAPAPVYAVDSFLYSEDDIEELVAAKKIAREYCTRCGCTDIGLADFITHSFSQDQLLYLSCFLLPHVLRQCITASAKATKTSKDTPTTPLSIVDVGSRLGVVLWACAFALQQGALVQPPSEEEEEKEEQEVHIVGVEMDESYVQLSHDVLRRFFTPRRRRAPRLDGTKSSGKNDGAEEAERAVMDVSAQLHFVRSNCFDGAGAEALAQASVLVLHNVFEYFSATPVEHAGCWLKLRRLVCRCRRGKFLVCSPALEETLSSFSADVWASAWAEEEKEGATANAKVAPPPPLAWLSTVVVRVDIDEVVHNFLTMRAVICYDDDDVEAVERRGCCGDDGCRDADDHGHGHGHGHGGAEEKAEDGEDSEVEEQIQKIYVYRVL